MNLSETHPLAPSWAELVKQTAPDLRTGASPWRLYKFGVPPLPLRTVPALPGPMIYAIPEGTSWYYVGQTGDPLRKRLAGHLREPDRRQLWAAVMALELRTDISAARLKQLESLGKEILQPRMGSRWPTQA